MKRVIFFVVLHATVSSIATAPLSVAQPFGGFIENRGQVHPAVRYYAVGSRASIYFTEKAVVLDLKEAGGSSALETGTGRTHRRTPPWQQLPRTKSGCAVWIRLEDTSSPPLIEAHGELTSRYNYFLGNEPARWHTKIPAYSEVIYRQPWPGIDLVFRKVAGGICYEVVPAPGANTNVVAFRYEGAEVIAASSNGSRTLKTHIGRLRVQRRSGNRAGGEITWAETAGAAGEWRDRPQNLVWSTFLGDAGYEQGFAVAPDSSGDLVVTGWTGSPDFPTTPGVYDQGHNGSTDVFVAKLSSSASDLLWATFLGGSSGEYGHALALDGRGRVLVLGTTDSDDFPTMAGAYDQSHNGGHDVFVATLSSSGSSLVSSTYLGGYLWEYGSDLALSSCGNPIVTGETNSPDFPTTPGAYDETHNGSGDVFVATLSSSLSHLIASTYLGGGSEDYACALALDESDNAVVTGWTASDDFPTTPGAYDESYNDEYDSDVFVAKLSSSVENLLWSTYLGGSSYDGGYDLALDTSGNPVVTGDTASPDFPTTPGAYDETHNGVTDVFVATLSRSGAGLVSSTYLGGTDDDYGNGVVVAPAGDAVLTGWTSSADFPTTPGAYDQFYNGGDSDAFISTVASSASFLRSSTYLGGSRGDLGYRLTLDPSGRPVATGTTDSPDFPTTPGAYDGSHNGNDDVFVVKLEADVSAVGDGPPRSPASVLLAAPNPFAIHTLIHYALAREAEVDLQVLDLTGRRVATLGAGVRPAGHHFVSWRARDDQGRPLGCGAYFLRMQAAGEESHEQIIVLR